LRWPKKEISAADRANPSQYRADPSPQPDPQTLADTKWFDVFKDQKLQDLIHEALVHNYDLRESVARIDLMRERRYHQITAIPADYGSAELTTMGRSRDAKYHCLNR
jgi:outer membrane protein TolC